jgi:hypothetical protein
MIGQALEHTRGGKGDPAPQPHVLGDDTSGIGLKSINSP